MPTSHFRMKDPIQLRGPDGRVLDTHVAGLEMVSGPNVRRDVVAFMLSKDITKQDIPPGTEIWLISEGHDSKQPSSQ